MATENPLLNLSFPASADLSSYQYRAVKLSGGQLALCDTLGEKAMGILQDAPAAAGAAGSVAVYGATKAVAGAAVTENDPVGPDASGKLIKMDEEDEACLGRALETAAAANVVFKVLITHEGSAAANQDVESFIAHANYSASGQYCAVKLHTDAGEIIKCATAGEQAIGILTNAPAATATALVKVAGLTTVKAGTAGWTAGDALAVEVTSGELVTAAAGQYIVGYALSTVTDGNTGSVLVSPHTSVTVVGQALANTKVWIGSAGGVAAEQTISGHAILAAGGALSVSDLTTTAAGDAIGDLIYRDAANTFQRLAIGAAGRVLQVNAGATAPQWAALSSDATIADGGAVTIANDVVSAAKMASTAGAGSGIIFKGSNTANAVTELNVPVGNVLVGVTNDVGLLDMGAVAGNIMVDSGTAPASVAVSGDASLSAAGAVTLAKNLIRSTNVDILAAAVKTLNATPVVLVDFSGEVAAGRAAAGDALIFHGAVTNLYGGAASYDQNENMTVVYQTGGGGATVSTTLANFCNGGAAGKLSTLKAIATDVVPDADEDLVVKCSASPWAAAGDRNMRVTVYWSVMTPHA
jgi:hypothetical protein